MTQKTLVISDNEIVNILYILNLEVYLGTDVIVAKTVDDATNLINSDKNIKLILMIDRIGKDDSSEEIISYIDNLKLDLPVIITGSNKEEVIDNKFFYLSGKFNVQSVLKSGAKALGVTAKQMATRDVGAYYPISISPLLLNLPKAPCAIYLKNSETEYKLVSRIDDLLSETLFKQDTKNIDHVYVSSNDRLVMINKISLAIIDKLTEKLKNIADTAPIEEKLDAISDSFEFAGSNLFTNEEVKQQMQEIAAASSKVMQSACKDVSGMKGLLDIMMANKNGYLFTHSMITSYVAYHMIKNVTWGGEGQAEKINFVLFFHDIFLAPIYLRYPELKFESDLLESNKLDEKEKDIVLNHARLSAEMVVTYKKCPMGADALIKQHHGMKKGKGFAKFYAEDLSPLAKIILIAEKFVEEFMRMSEAGGDLKPSGKLIVPKLISEFKSPSYTKIAKALDNIPL